MALPKIKADPLIHDALEKLTAQGIKIFLVHGLTDNGYCTCGKPISECFNPKDVNKKVQAGKHPITEANSPYPKVEKVNKQGEKYKVPSWPLASTDDAKKLQHFLQYYNYNLAFHSGANDAITTDIDTPEGINWFIETIKIHPEWFDTPIDYSGYADDTKTIRGIHIHHKQPKEHVYGFNTKYGEVRCDEQYVVISPSKHISGVRYEPYPEHSWSEKKMTPMPDALLEQLKALRKEKSSDKKEQLDPNNPEFKKPIKKLSREEFLTYLDRLKIPDYFHNLLMDEDVPVGSRSDVLYYLEHKLTHFCSYEQICVLLYNCAFNKFEDRPERLRYEVNQALIDEGRLHTKPKEVKEFKREPAQSFREFILSEVPMEMWTVRHCLLKESKSLIAGESKSGKSTLAYILAVSVASGKNFLNDPRFTVDKPGSVMFIDGENSKRYIKRQAIQACLALGIYRPDYLENAYVTKPEAIKNMEMPNIYIYDAGYGLNFKDAEGMAFIEEEIKRIKPALVIWDSFYTFFTGDVKEEKDVLPILNNLSQWREQYSCGFAVVVHFNKGANNGTSKVIDINRISGTKVFGNWYETAWLVSNPNATVDDTGEEIENDEDDLAGKMTIELRCLFREARKRMTTIEMEVTSTSCNIVTKSGIVKQEKEIKKLTKKDEATIQTISEFLRLPENIHHYPDTNEIVAYVRKIYAPEKEGEVNVVKGYSYATINNLLKEHNGRYWKNITTDDGNTKGGVANYWQWIDPRENQNIDNLPKINKDIL